MRRLLLIPLILLIFVPVFAQGAPDYRPSKIGDSYSPTTDVMTVNFTVFNAGGTASEDATATLTWLLSDNTRNPLVNESIPPIPPNTSVNGTFTFPMGTPWNLPRGEVINMQIEIRLPGTPNTPPITATSDLFSLRIPQVGEQQSPNTPSPTTQSAADDGIITLPLVDLQVDTNDPLQVLILVGIIVSGLVLIIILWLMLRLIFRRTPAFGTWQPPYATMPPHEPNTIYGRRQLWQQHAQNNVVTIPCREVQARKLLLGTNNQYLAGWRILAVRMTQYDMYGRVSRSEVLASGGMVKRLNRAAHKNLSEKQQHRWARPAAKYLSKRFKKRINARSAMLPIALDVRLQGHHGEVRILFELYECQQNYPHRLDQWEPEMTVIGKNIYESYTYTLFGQNGGETYKDFRRRIMADVEAALVQLLHVVSVTQPQPAQPVAQPQSPITQPTPPPPDTNPNMKAVELDSIEDDEPNEDTIQHQSDG